MTLETAYVFTDRPGKPVLAGRVEYEDRLVGRFRYARSFLESGNAFALDPLNLPLRLEAHELTSKPWIHGAILDAGPDDWGRRSLLYRGKDAAGLSPLILGSGTGVGSLLFSLSRSSIKPRAIPPRFDDMRALFEGVRAIDEGHRPPLEIEKLLDAGSSMGGARPKAVVEMDGSLWLAKFPSRTDVVDQPACEAAALNLARAAGIRVPEFRLEKIDGKNVLLVRRFDVHSDPRTEGARHHHYLSMSSLLTVGRILNPESRMRSQSYMAFANVLAAHGTKPREDRVELFRRMVFNVLIGHVDDHQRNHGLLLRHDACSYELSPCFDIAPSNGNVESVSRLPDEQAISIGKEGAVRSFRNLLSSVQDFGLNTAGAEAVVREVYGVVRGWREAFARSGVSRVDQDRIAHRVLAPALLADAPKHVFEEASLEPPR